jgi:hypothetical protein
MPNDLGKWEEGWEKNVIFIRLKYILLIYLSLTVSVKPCALCGASQAQCVRSQSVVVVVLNSVVWKGSPKPISKEKSPWKVFLYFFLLHFCSCVYLGRLKMWSTKNVLTKVMYEYHPQCMKDNVGHTTYMVKLHFTRG